MRVEIIEYNDKSQYCYNTFHIKPYVVVYFDNPEMDLENAIKLCTRAVDISKYIDLIKKIVYKADCEAYFSFITNDTNYEPIHVSVCTPQWNEGITIQKGSDTRIRLFKNSLDLIFESDEKRNYIMTLYNLRKHGIPIRPIYTNNDIVGRPIYTDSQLEFAKKFINNGYTISEVVDFNRGDNEMWSGLYDSYHSSPEVFAHNMRKKQLDLKIPDETYTENWI